MKNIFRIVDRIANWLVIAIVPLLVLAMLWDTFEAFTNPENYRHVQYQVDWMAEGFWSYVFRNFAFTSLGIIFWLSGFQKVRNKGLLWMSVYYSIWFVLLASAIYNGFRAD